MEISKGFGCKEDEKELIAALDDIFFSEEPHNNFMDLLPKLYKDKYNCGEKNLIIKEDGVIKAAVGCFPSTPLRQAESCVFSALATWALQRIAAARVI